MVRDGGEVANLASLVRLAQERDLIVKLGVDGGGNDFGVVSGLFHFLPFCTLPCAAGFIWGFVCLASID